MSEITSNAAVAAGEIAGYPIERELAAGRSYVAVAPGGRRVVLKSLEADCLLAGQLHPMIKDRLGRVRELAHLGVANLLGAERSGEEAWLVWEHVEGQTLEEHLRHGGSVPADLARRLVLSIEALHSLGIVHGALHVRNVIMLPSGAVRLTHVSPLLYDDPQADADALAEILEAIGCPLGEGSVDMKALRQASNALAGRGTGAAGEDEGGEGGVQADAMSKWPRRRALAGAALAAILGVALAWGLWRWGGGAAEPPAGSDVRAVAP